ncbi:MAG: mechanosensitive ion channel [Proteobacteria bacterium]|nr:mechanosensitive ion channel [Pseudomonadota bacterium]
MTDFLRTWLLDPTVGKFVAAAIGLVLVAVVVKIAQRWVGGHVKEADSRYRVRKFLAILGYALALGVLAMVFSDRLGGLTVALGVAGAGIAFALQEVIASVAGWVAISTARFFRTGDRVQLGGIVGDVIDIGILRTTLMELGQWVKADLYNGRIVRVANSFVFKEPVFNYSADFPFLWDELTVPVRYGSDAGLAREILLRETNAAVGDYVEFAREHWQQMLDKYLIEPASVETRVFLVLTDNWMEFTVRYVVDYKLRRGTRDRIFTGLLEAFEKTGGRVAVASSSMELHVMRAPPVDIRVQGPDTAVEGDGAP